ncbi:MAG TPA: DASS family sodium-coupled anion symporter, partial [Gemmatimonadales bacterium]|nr:DASS family sodium-coupled anion symporter [Gemmatimonadales bacterium]
MPDDISASQASPHRRLLGLALGPLLLALTIALPAPVGLSAEAWKTAGVTLLMISWWVTETVPIPVTALLPLICFPLLGILRMEAAAAPYANPVVFLFLGGFLLARAVEKWGLHRRAALFVVGKAGTEPARLVGGFMLASALLSMWISNTATTIMMLPIGVSIIGLMEAAEQGAPRRSSSFGLALMLGIAYGASIGGVGTLIGTPPNALLAGFMLENYGFRVGFLDWMMIGLPVVAIFLPLAWWVLTRWVFSVDRIAIPGAEAIIAGEVSQLGSPSRGERMVAGVFILTALAWILRPVLEQWLPGLTDTGIAIAAAILLFLLPVHPSRGEYLLDWKTAEGLPWGVLLLSGGGLSLAAAVASTGLAAWTGEGLAQLGDFPVIVLMLAVTLVLVFLTEIMSNTAALAAFLPVIAALSLGLGAHPMLLAVPAAIGASCAFMLPMATPPNAIVFGSGRITIPQMARAGIVLN